jgi:uncharacterized metal-binding protein
MTTTALNSDQIGKLGIGIIIAMVVLGFLLSLVITAIVGRLVILLVVVVLAVVVWQQRTEIKNKVADCKLNGTFFGVHVSAPKDVISACHRTG